MKRLHTLDYLRGTAALGIMIFHFLISSSYKFHAESFLGRVGIYGICVFYILSGLTLYYVYHDKLIATFPSVVEFLNRRISRIFPLLWLVTLVFIILSKSIPNLKVLLLNITGLFGFFAPRAYLSEGQWSIGNELVFYSLFPIILLTAIHKKILYYNFSFIVVLLFLVFTFSLLSPGINLANQWIIYINPFNQLFYFIAGIWIGKLFLNTTFALKEVLILSTLGLGLFIFWPSYGDPIHLVSGGTRLIFAISCILICFSVFKMPEIRIKSLHWLMSTLGEISYSVYLLHPLVFGELKNIIIKYNYEMPVIMEAILGIIIVLPLSYLVYRFYEKPFMNIMNKMFAFNSKSHMI